MEHVTYQGKKIWLNHLWIAQLDEADDPDWKSPAVHGDSKEQALDGMKKLIAAKTKKRAITKQGATTTASPPRGQSRIL